MALGIALVPAQVNHAAVAYAVNSVGYRFFREMDSSAVNILHFPSFGRSCCMSALIECLQVSQSILFQCSSASNVTMGVVLLIAGHVIHWFRWVVVLSHVDHILRRCRF